jgi:2',3'-cyclic-nucleotide 2'-phosphodiesterase (5'-nucleotidase family)
MKTLARLTLPLLAFGTIAAQSPAQPPAPDVPLSLNLPEGALVAPGPAPDLELLYTGDVIGYLEDCGCHLNPAGGLSRRAWLLNQLQANYPTTPLVLFDFTRWLNASLVSSSSD